ncbi:DUF3267 domain-containing protein [Cecembia rubra]|uniref:Putative zincin peptidase n=1 Tax=Cecembia rubra TaxID=1485585 RepID=A0A2P8E1D9_9BACT|nr:DUF3267 domain-containing protein [Cecembia rubra]PSL03291.1 putative zincin peptidase [Cecembia rubra]
MNKIDRNSNKFPNENSNEEAIEQVNKQFEEYTMEMGKANWIAILLAFPISLLLLIPFVLIWDFDTLRSGWNMFTSNYFLFLISGVIIHELLHGLTWAYFVPNKFRSIKFGFKWKYLTPYYHCKGALKVKHYRIGGAMPLIVMGIIPAIIGLIMGDGGILSYGLFFTCAGGGDIIALYMLRKFNDDDYLYDHPEKLGFLKEIA